MNMFDGEFMDNTKLFELYIRSNLVESDNIDLAHKIMTDVIKSYNLNLQSKSNGFYSNKFTSKDEKRKFVLDFNKICKDQAIDFKKSTDSPVYQWFNGRVEKKLGAIYPGATQYCYRFPDDSELTMISILDEDNEVKITYQQGPFYRDSYI